MKSVTLVIPCKDEAKRLDREGFLEAVRTHPELSLLFVDDGSSDATTEVIAHLANLHPSIATLILPKNVGKAEAVRAGVRHLLARGSSDLIGFWDADLATPFEELKRFLWAFETRPQLGLVIGSRWPHLGAHVDRCVFRSCTGSVMKFFIRRVLSAPIYDTQCGAKIMTRALAAELFARPFLSRWLFDVELFRRLGRKRILTEVMELPLDSWHDIKGSKMTTLGALRSLVDLVRIAYFGALAE